MYNSSSCLKPKNILLNFTHNRWCYRHKCCKTRLLLLRKKISSFAASTRKIETNAELTVLSASHKSVSLYVLTSTHLFSDKKRVYRSSAVVANQKCWEFLLRLYFFATCSFLHHFLCVKTCSCSKLSIQSKK